MNKFLIIITFYGADSFRVRNLKAVINRVNQVWEGTDICLVEQNGETEVEGVTFHHNVHVEGELFHKTKLLNEAVKLHQDYTHYVMLDADSYIDAGVVDNIINHCNDAPLLFPYETCVYLNEAQTRVKCKETSGDILIKYNSNIPITRQAGLINCFSKETYDKVHGFDEEFKGWGAEDDAFIFKVRRVCGRELRAKGGVVLHLWHKKANTKDYLDSMGYKRNRGYCSLIRRLSDDEFNEYLNGRLSLEDGYKELADKYKISEWIPVPIGMDHTIKIDSSIYFLKGENPTIYDVLNEVIYEDGIEYTKTFIKSYILPYELLPEVKELVDKFMQEHGIVYEN